MYAYNEKIPLSIIELELYQIVMKTAFNRFDFFASFNIAIAIKTFKIQTQIHTTKYMESIESLQNIKNLYFLTKTKNYQEE